MRKPIGISTLILSIAPLLAAGENSAPDAAPAPVQGDAWTSPSTGMAFVWIETLELWVATYETTNGEYRGKEPGHDSGTFMEHSLNGDRQPVVNVHFLEAVQYGEWLTEQERAANQLPAGYTYRLPSEAEWLAFARCGDTRKYPWGASWPPVHGNYRGQEAQGRGDKIEGYDDGHVATCNVEDSGRNEWGLYGVGGNVWEAAARRCEDENCKTCGSWRGGSWDSAAEGLLRCTFRSTGMPNYRFNNYGFRLVLAKEDA